MREIKFRGKKTNTNTWLYGSLINNAFYTRVDGKPNCQIFDPRYVDYDCFEDIGEQLMFCEVNPGSVGQFTGLTDKNGREIYEGDIVDTLDGLGKVIYDIHLCTFSIEYDNSMIAFIHYVTQENATLEVIGTIYENPDLLEATK